MWIREALDEDLPALEKLEEECFTDSWSPALMSQMFANDYDKIFVLEDEGSILGYANVRNLDGDCDLMVICVDKDNRCKGYGTLLLERVMNYAESAGAKQIFLEVRKSNAAAQALYNKFKFETLGERRDYYSNPTENAIVMRYLC